MIKPYGSLNLNNGYVSSDFLDSLFKQKNTLKIVCDEDLQMECDRIADGSFTPVDGFFGKQEIDSIIQDHQLLNGVYFPIPVILQVPQSFTGIKNENVCLVTRQNEILGYIENASTFTYDMDQYCQSVFGIKDLKHPGVARYKERGDCLLSGKVRMKKKKNALSQFCLSPKETRDYISQAGWKNCVGFQTRNVAHKAHEYLQRIALEVFGAILIHPIIGWKKKGDYQPEVVMKTYSYLVENIYPKDKVLLSGLQSPMYYAGPKEAVLHAIIRQNYGCTHFIVGRDHAGVGQFYGTYEAQDFARSVQGHLDIQFLCLKGPRFCNRCEDIVTENTCRHGEEFLAEVSGSFIRESLSSGIYPPKNLIRSELIDIIRGVEKIFVDS